MKDEYILLVFFTLFAIMLNKNVTKEKGIIIVRYIINVYKKKMFRKKKMRTRQDSKFRFTQISYPNDFQFIMHNASVREIIG